MKPEEAAVRQIMDGLKWSGAHCWRIRERIPAKGYKWQALSDAGIPDLYFILRVEDCAYSGWIEVKAAGGVLRPAQRDFLESCHKAGILAFVAHNFDEVVGEFAKVGVKLRAGNQEGL